MRLLINLVRPNSSSPFTATIAISAATPTLPWKPAPSNTHIVIEDGDVLELDKD